MDGLRFKIGVLSFKIRVVRFKIGVLRFKRGVLRFKIEGLRVYMGMLRFKICLLYTSPSPRDKRQSRMPSSA